MAPKDALNLPDLDTDNDGVVCMSASDRAAILATKKEIAHQILDIRDTLWLRSGDDYWQALYRLKALACQLSELVLQQKD